MLLENVDYFYEAASMSEAYTFSIFSNVKGVRENMTEVLQKGSLIRPHHIQEQLIQIEKSSISHLKTHVVEAYNNGIIQLVHYDKAKVPIAIPFIIRKTSSGATVATIFISSFGAFNSTGEYFNIQMKQLYILMEAAYVALNMQVNWSKFEYKMELMKITCNMYVLMLLQLVNKECAISLDKVLYNQVTYCISRFYLERLWGCENKQVIEVVSRGMSPDKATISLYDSVSIGYGDANIKTIDDLLTYIKTLSPRMEPLKTRFFIERYINMFGQTAVMSIDYLPYLFMVFINTLLGGVICSLPTMTNIAKQIKGIQSFYSELAKIV